MLRLALLEFMRTCLLLVVLSVLALSDVLAGSVHDYDICAAKAGILGDAVEDEHLLKNPRRALID